MNLYRLTKTQLATLAYNCYKKKYEVEKILTQIQKIQASIWFEVFADMCGYCNKYKQNVFDVAEDDLRYRVCVDCYEKEKNKQ